MWQCQQGSSLGLRCHLGQTECSRIQRQLQGTVTARDGECSESRWGGEHHGGSIGARRPKREPPLQGRVAAALRWHLSIAKTATWWRPVCCKMQRASSTDEHPPVSIAPPIDPSGALGTISGAWRAVNYGRQLAHTPASRCGTDELSSRLELSSVIW